jgi:hypothetical protein
MLSQYRDLVTTKSFAIAITVAVININQHTPIVLVLLRTLRKVPGAAAL